MSIQVAPQVGIISRTYLGFLHFLPLCLWRSPHQSLLRRFFLRSVLKRTPHLQHPSDQRSQAALLWNLPIDGPRDQRQLQVSAQHREFAPDLPRPLWISAQKADGLFVEGKQADLWRLQFWELNIFQHAAPQVRLFRTKVHLVHSTVYWFT